MGIAYEAAIESNDTDYSPKKCIGICETTFKKRFGNHIKSFDHEQYEKKPSYRGRFGN